MKPIAKIDCKINDTFYSKGDEINVEKIEQVRKLNEWGFIEPLTEKQMQEYFNKKLNFNKKEE